MSRRLALCVGHSRQGDNGAVSAGGVTEWKFNSGVARALAHALAGNGIEVRTWDYYGGTSYGAAVRWLAAEVRKFRADAAVELHFNAAGPDAHGFEYLYWRTSPKGKALAQALTASHKAAFPGRRNRGAKGLGAGSRGAGFLRGTHCPAVITEPFFGTNEEEWNYYSNHTPELVAAYARGITAYFTG